MHSRERQASHESYESVAKERLEVAKERLEQAEKAHHERLSTDEALEQAKELAKTSEKPEEQAYASPAERRRGPITKKQLNNSFSSQMKQTQAHMSPTARTFSRFIHYKPVEAVSDIVGSTIARPNALLTGSITAFAAVTILYFVAKHYGFQLSGFEAIGAFVIGWLLGILYDYFALMIRGHK